jgi:hypothetical protein
MAAIESSAADGAFAEALAAARDRLEPPAPVAHVWPAIAAAAFFAVAAMVFAAAAILAPAPAAQFAPAADVRGPV